MLRSTIAWRTACKVGLGGGPLILFFPPHFCETAMLQERVSDHCHESMTVKALPRSSLEVIEAKLFFQLLMSLLADPSRFDGSGQGAQVRFGRQVSEIVFLLA